MYTVENGAESFPFVVNAGREVRRILQVTGLEALFELRPVPPETLAPG